MMNNMQPPSRQKHDDDQVIPNEVWPFEDRDSFTHGVCRSGTWVGPGRRPRGVAASDAELHALAGCESTETFAATVGATVGATSAAPKIPDVAPGRERLTARGRS
jgi:hypothetical protein